MRAVYLIGLNHQYQIGPNGAIPVEATAQDFSEFADFLRGVIARNAIRAIAEEMSLAALRKHWVRGDSFPCCLAAEIGLPHRYCDPDLDTQKALGITSSTQREQYWIKELIDFDLFPVLFILGANHIESFKGLLIESDLQPFVVAQDWEPRSSRG
jgi:hypothetical protein